MVATIKVSEPAWDYKWISYHPQDWGIRISCLWFRCHLHMEFKVNHFSYPQLPSRSHSDISRNTLLGIVWKKAKHYYSTMLLKASLAYHQLSCNIDRSTIFLLSLYPFTLPTHLLCLLSLHWKYSSPLVTVLVNEDFIQTQSFHMLLKYQQTANTETPQGRGPEQVTCTFPELNVYSSSWQHLEACKPFTCTLEIAI